MSAGVVERLPIGVRSDASRTEERREVASEPPSGCVRPAGTGNRDHHGDGERGNDGHGDPGQPACECGIEGILSGHGCGLRSVAHRDGIG